MVLLLLLLGGASTRAAAAHWQPRSEMQIPGADPTGVRDSSAALNAEVQRLCPGASVGVDLLESYVVPREAVLELGGGVYRMDAPLLINRTVHCSGVLRVRGGTLLAGAALGGLGNQSFLVAVLDYWQGLGVTLENVIFASNSSGGGLRVDAAHHVHVIGCTFLNFATVGIWGSKLLGMGHDLTVTRCRLTECTAPMAECADINGKKATAILIEFPDSHFRNSVITCGRAGVVNRGGANTFHELHIWTSCTGDALPSTNTTVGFSDEAGSTRISDMYMDNCIMRIIGLRGTTLTNSFFNAAAMLQIGPNVHAVKPLDKGDIHCQYWRGALCGLVVTNNRFACNGPTCARIDMSQYNFTSAKMVYVEANAFEDPGSTLCTTARHSCDGDECKSLLGPCPP